MTPGVSELYETALLGHVARVCNSYPIFIYIYYGDVHDLDRGLKCRPILVEHCTKWTMLGKRSLCEIDFKM